MTEQDILRSKHIVENYLGNNGLQGNIYAQNPQNSWGLYVNWTNRVITIHGPTSNQWQAARTNPGPVSNTYSRTNNGLWIGPFPSFAMAYTFGALLRCVTYLDVHEEMTLASSHGVVHIPYKIF